MNEELLKRLDVLAAKLGVTAQYLWGVLVRQARVQLVTDILAVILTAIFLYALFRWWKSAIGRSGGDIIDLHPVEAISLIFMSISGVIAMVTAVIATLEIPGLLFNPEYFALQQILQALK